MIQEKLEEFNEWWFTGQAPKELALEKRRHLFRELAGFLDKRQIISIVGLRRVGKTTLMYQLIDHLIKHGKDENKIIYFSFDEKVENLNDVIGSYKEIKNIDFRKQKVYVFLDEIQKLEKWTNQVKKYYDLYPKIKFVISGSEGLFLSSKTKEALAGRIYEFLLKPLSFGEYIYFRGYQREKLSTDKAKSLFTEFISRGGFPEAVGKSVAEIKMYVKSAVVDKIIFQDISKTAGIKDMDLMKTLIEILAANPGMYLEYQSIAKQLDRDRRVIKSYITLLEQSFLAKILGNYRKGKLSSLRKTKKIYLTDTAVITAYKTVIDTQFFAKIVESAVVNSVDSRNFWKNRQEVDLIIDKKPVEIKYKSRIIDKDLLGTREFMKKFSVREGTILTKDQEGAIKVPEGKIALKPVWKFLLGMRDTK